MVNVFRSRSETWASSVPICLGRDSRFGLRLFDVRTWVAFLAVTRFLTPVCVAHDVLLDGHTVGPVFEGIGACSAGASSRFLAEYPAGSRREILDYLFRPRYGAGFQHLKVEIGGDVNSTDGVEPSHQHTRNDLDFTRGYEWWLMREARHRNRAVLLEALAWGAPGWIGDGRFYSQDMADYIVRFIQGARSVHGLTLDYVGIWNETPYEPGWIKLLRGTLDSASLAHVRIVAADQVNNWDLINQMASDPALRDAVAVVGVHYPGTKSPVVARACGKPLWSSEDGPWRGDWEGAKALARMYNRNYVEGRFTKTIIWSPVTAYYDGLPLPASGVMRANEPWSGHYEVQPAVWATAHTTQFAEPGWRYLDGSGCGWLDGGGSYVVLKAPESGHFSIITETMDARAPQTVTFRLRGGLTQRTLWVWRTSKGDHFQRVARVRPEGATFTLRFDPESIYSITTTGGQRKGGAAGPGPQVFPSPYEDDFDRYQPGSAPRYFSDQAGVFEVHPRADGQGQCLRQVMTRKGIEWHFHNDPFPETIVGDRHWRDYAVRVEGRYAADGFLSVFGRVAQVPQSAAPPDGYWFRVDAHGRWEVLASTNRIARGTTTLDGPRWRQLELRFEGETIQASVDGRTVTNVVDRTFRCGMAGIGCGWHPADFDNFQVMPLAAQRVVPRSPPTPALPGTIPPRSTRASSQWDFSYPAERATDGDPATRWCSARSKTAGEWLELDLGRMIGFERVVIEPFDAHITNHRLQCWDGERWTDMAAGGPLRFPVHDVSFVQVTGSKVRLLVTEADGPPSIWNLAVYAPTMAKP